MVSVESDAVIEPMSSMSSAREIYVHTGGWPGAVRRLTLVALTRKLFRDAESMVALRQKPCRNPLGTAKHCKSWPERVQIETLHTLKTTTKSHQL